MPIPSSRRSFLAASAGAAGAALWPQFALGAVRNDTLGFRLGVASYSLREFQRGLAIRMIRMLQTPYVSVKEYHLPIDAPPAEWARGRREFERAGLQIVSGGNIDLHAGDPADIRHKFDYARAAGMPMIVCAPSHTDLAAIEKCVKEYDIRIAIHNHGPEDKYFPTPQSVLEAVKNMDPRCGLCMDMGHSARAGVDVVATLAEAGSRLFDIHMKDLRSFTDAKSQCVVGEGAMPVVAIFRQLHKMGYRGSVNLEYEIEPDNPLPGMQRSFSYMRGVLAALAA